MRNKMDTSMKPENEQEEQIAQLLEYLRRSDEVQEFSRQIEKIAETNDVKRLRSRIKETNSAIRTFKKAKMSNIEQAHDYCGYTLITEDEKNIPNIVEQVKELLPNAEYLDFTDEKHVYLPYFKIKKCPPLSYIILAREQTKEKMDFPIEIRVCSKEGFISEQAPYYTIWKNDELDDWEIKNKLRDICQHITYKLAILDMRKGLLDEQREKHIIELTEVLKNNKVFLAKYKDIFESVISEYGRLVYEFENYNEISKLNSNLTEIQQDDMIENIRNQYLATFKSYNGLSFIDRINQSTCCMRKNKCTNFLVEVEKKR